MIFLTYSPPTVFLLILELNTQKLLILIKTLPLLKCLIQMFFPGNGNKKEGAKDHLCSKNKNKLGICIIKI